MKNKLLLLSVTLFCSTPALASETFLSLNCTTFKNFGYVAVPKFYFNVKESNTNPINVSIGSLLIPSSTGGAAKNVIIGLVEQDETNAFFEYNDVAVTYNKNTKTASFTKPMENGLNQVYAFCAK